MFIEEPKLMPFQEHPFNADTFVADCFLGLKIAFEIDTIVETGTCLGYSTEWMAKNYKNVITLEVVDKYFTIAKTNRLLKHKNVKMVLGSSATMLYDLIKGLTDKTMFFLDAHWQNSCPLKEELAQIAKAKLRPVIAIHDFKVPNRDDLGFDSYNGQEFTYEWLKPDFDKVYGVGKYTHFYNKETAGAKRGVIYVVPKN